MIGGMTGKVYKCVAASIGKRNPKDSRVLMKEISDAQGSGTGQIWR
jgi:hypothetical protein